MKSIHLFLLFSIFHLSLHAKSIQEFTSQEVNSPILSLKESHQLSGYHLIGMFHPDDTYLPYWEITIQPDYYAGMSEEWPGHNIDCSPYLGNIDSGQQIIMEYELPERVGEESAFEVQCKVIWGGDDIEGIIPNTDYFPLYKTASEEEVNRLENRTLTLSNVKQIARLTGKSLPGETMPNPNRTDERYDVGGTDLGIIWDMGNGRCGLAFGDTYGSKFTPQPGGGPTGGPAGTPDAHKTVDNWRSNFVAFSTDWYLEDGLTFSGVLVDEDNKAREVIPSDHDESGNGDFTTIPTAAIRLEGIDYIHYMSIKEWGTAKGWDTNFSSLYLSRDDGQTWQRSANVLFPPDSYFSQTSYFLRDGYVYMIGTPSGRSGNAYLGRFPENAIEDMSEYEYWNTEKGWVKQEKQATILFNAPVGEISLLYQEKYNRWIAVYFNSEKYALVYRTVAQITDKWSEERVLVSGHDYPQLYGAFMHPLKNAEDEIYFVMSLWQPYNVFLMKADLGWE